MTSLPKISNLDENNDTLKFTLSNINLSYANAIRRTIIADIPCIVFKSTPYNENNIDIKVNKSRLNNELLKQRISCIPIHINKLNDFPYEKYKVELHVVNTSNNIIYVTTENFKIKNIESNTYLEKEEVKEIFPPNKITGDYIDIIRLRPKLTDTSDPEEIKLESKLTISNAKDDATFNVACTCSYGNTLDPIKIKDAWDEKEKILKTKMGSEEINFAKKDWLLLDAKRLYIEDSYDFTIETVGIYTNYKLIELSISIIIQRLYLILQVLKNDDSLINESNDTLDNCYVITLENEDYTIGKILEYCLYSKYFLQEKSLDYVGFLKKHPHDNNSIIKVSSKNLISKDDIIIMLENSVNNSIILLNNIKDYFKED
tara:strand:- start:258 stop:1376 length:1119 start_codon:yes stop_codon:yes gene_type:complete